MYNSHVSISLVLQIKSLISNTNTYIYAYSSTYGTYNKAWPGKTLSDYGATFLNNSLYKLSIDDNYDYFIINNNDKQTDSIVTKDSSSNTI